MLTLLVIRAVHVIATEWRVLHYVTDRASDASEEARSSSRVAYRRPPQATKDSNMLNKATIAILFSGLAIATASEPV